MSSRDDAKEAVDRIGRKFGFVSDDIMGEIEQWRPDIRRIIEESMLAKDQLAAHSIKTYVALLGHVLIGGILT